MGKVWTILSGKGGVGKSTITAALGGALSNAKLKVCIIDGDTGLRDQDLILGVENRVIYDLVDVCNHTCNFEQAAIAHPDFPGLYLLPASQFASIKDLDRKAFRKLLADIKQRFDIVLIDCPAGIDRGLKSVMNEQTDETLVIVTPDDVCIRNAERANLVLEKKNMPSPQVIVNRLIPSLITNGEMYNARTVAETLDLPLFGEIPEDEVVYRSLLQKVPLINCKCEAAEALKRIALRMQGSNVELPEYGMHMGRLQRILAKWKEGSIL